MLHFLLPKRPASRQGNPPVLHIVLDDVQGAELMAGSYKAPLIPHLLLPPEPPSREARQLASAAAGASRRALPVSLPALSARITARLRCLRTADDACSTSAV